MFRTGSSSSATVMMAASQWRIVLAAATIIGAIATAAPTSDGAPLGSMFVAPSILQRSMDAVKVRWTSVPGATFLGVFVDGHNEHPLHVMKLSFFPDSDIQGPHGMVTLPLPNIRQRVVLKLLAEDGTQLAEASPISFANPDEPVQGHLALTQNPTEMRLVWVSNSSAPGGSLVMYGESPTTMTTTRHAVTSTYSASDMCDEPATTTGYVAPGQIHDVLLTDLPKGKTVYYKYGSEKGYSEVYSFHVGPKTEGKLKFIAFGDMGVAPHEAPAADSAKVIQTHVETVKDTEAVLHIGDISYARGHEYIWNQFFSEIQPYAVRVPYMVGVGNHDFDYKGQPFKPWWSSYGTDSGGECGVPYRARFKMPYPKNKTAVTTAAEKVKGDDKTPLYYSVNMGPVHFTFMDSENDFLKGSPQYEWLQNDLANVDRKKTPFVIFLGHRPFYETTVDILLPEVKRMREELEPLFVDYSVDMVLVGHVHVYERTCRVVKEKCDTAGPVHMVIGNAGNADQAPWADKPRWLEHRSFHFGVTHFDVQNATHLHVQALSNPDGAVEDDFWVVRSE